MIHRRLLNDDWKGVNEPLNESEKNGTIGLTQRMKHWLVFADLSENRDRMLQYQLDTAAIVVLANNSLPEFLRDPRYEETTVNADTYPVIEGFKVYLKDMDNDEYLLRLMNNDDQNDQIFVWNYDYEEMSLTANQKKSDMESNKLKWMKETKIDQNFTRLLFKSNLYNTTNVTYTEWSTFFYINF